MILGFQKKVGSTEWCIVGYQYINTLRNFLEFFKKFGIIFHECPSTELMTPRTSVNPKTFVFHFLVHQIFYLGILKQILDVFWSFALKKEIVITSDKKHFVAFLSLAPRNEIVFNPTYVLESPTLKTFLVSFFPRFLFFIGHGIYKEIMFLDTVVSLDIKWDNVTGNTKDVAFRDIEIILTVHIANSADFHVSLL